MSFVIVESFGNSLRERMSPPGCWSRAISAAFHEVQFQAEVRRAHPLSLKLTRLGGAEMLDGLVRALTTLRPAVDAFFEGVMVMDENPARRANRIALLAELKRLIGAVADLARLPA